MTGETKAGIRLCPNCANSIAEDATDCRYCKADLSAQFTPKWLKRGEPSTQPGTSVNRHGRLPIPAYALWAGAVIVAALIAFFAGGAMQRNHQSAASEGTLKQLQAQEQIIQTQEAQLTQTRQQLNESSQQLAETKSKLEASQKELALTQQRLSAAARQADRANASRSPIAPRSTSRATPAAASVAQPAAATRTAAPGVYETTRPTAVHESPSSTSRVIVQIDSGTRINVAGSAGGWLEVRSKHGNPPGYVRADDARVIGRNN